MDIQKTEDDRLTCAKECKTIKNWPYLCYIVVWMVQICCVGSQGLCYSQSQRSCRAEWNQLIEAEINTDYSSICRYFGGVHECTTKFTSHCRFGPPEKELYETDIVKVYTHKPFSCHLIGGNMKYRGVYDTSGVATSTINRSTFPWILTVASYVLLPN